MPMDVGVCVSFFLILVLMVFDLCSHLFGLGKVKSWSSLFSIGMLEMHTLTLRCSIQKLFQLFLLTFKSIWKTFDHVIVRVSFGNSVAKLTEVMKHSILMRKGKWQFPPDPTFHITIYLVLSAHRFRALSRSISRPFFSCCCFSII